MPGRALTIYLDRKVFFLLEKKAKESGKSLSKIVQDALLKHLRGEERRMARQKIEPSRDCRRLEFVSQAASLKEPFTFALPAKPERIEAG